MPPKTSYKDLREHGIHTYRLQPYNRWLLEYELLYQIQRSLTYSWPGQLSAHCGASWASWPRQSGLVA